MANKLLISTAALLTVTASLALTPNGAVKGGNEYGSLKGREAALVQRSKGLVQHGSATPGKKRSLGVVNDLAAVEKYGELSLILEEDFSLCSTGSEEAPDMETMLEYEWGSEDFEYPWNNMRKEYVHGDLRWGIGNAYAAGGCVYFAFSQENPEAHVVLPMTDYSANDGTFVVAFRAKAVKDSEILAFNVQVSDTRNWGPTWFEFDNPVEFTEISDDWKTYYAIFQNGEQYSLSQIYAAGFSGGMYIDDVKLYTLKPHVKTPKLSMHTDFTQTSFKANWQPVDGAEKYLLSVWSLNEAGDKEYVLTDKEVDGTSYNVEGVLETKTYYYDVAAVKGENVSLRPLPYEVFDIVAPEMMPAIKTSTDDFSYTGRISPVASATNYNYTAFAERKAEADGEFVLTNEEFTGFCLPGVADEDKDRDGKPVWTIENPYDMVSSEYYPHDLTQDGWHGENFMSYKDFLCLDPWHYEMAGEQAAWISPDFDLSKDGGKISVDMKLAAKQSFVYDEQGNVDGTYYSDCLVGLYNWNDEKNDYDQVELVRCTDTNGSWKPYHVDLTKGSKRSKIAFFAVRSLDNLYIDDIVIKQNYKKDETFMDPFYFAYWKESNTPVEQHTFGVPRKYWGLDVYNNAQAARLHLDARGSYDGEAISRTSSTDYVGNIPTTGIKFTLDEGNGTATMENGVIRVQNPDEAEVLVINMEGKAVRLGNAAELTYSVDRGVYVVRIGEKRVKLVF